MKVEEKRQSCCVIFFVLGSFANLLTLIVMKYGNIWFNALDLTINTLFILREEVIVHFLHY